MNIATCAAGDSSGEMHAAAFEIRISTPRCCSCMDDVSAATMASSLTFNRWKHGAKPSSARGAHTAVPRDRSYAVMNFAHGRARSAGVNAADMQENCVNHYIGGEKSQRASKRLSNAIFSVALSCKLCYNPLHM